jgi:hypothetical protein
MPAKAAPRLLFRTLAPALIALIGIGLAACSKAPPAAPPPAMEVSVAVVTERDITE